VNTGRGHCEIYASPSMDARPPTVREMLESGLAAGRARLGLVVLVALLISGALIASSLIAPSYDARLSVAFNPGNVVQAVFNEPRDTQAPPTAGELKGSEVLEALARRVGVDANGLEGQLRVEQTAGNEREATLIASAPTSRRATDLVNQWGAVYIERRRKVQGDAIFAARREIRSRADELVKNGSGFQRREILRQVLAVEAAEFDPADAQVVSFDGVQSDGVSLPLALLLGLATGAGLAVLLALLDGKLRTRGAIESQTGLPTIHAASGDVTSLRNYLYATVGTSSPRLTLLSGFGSPDGSLAVGRALAASLASEGRRTAVVTASIAENGPVVAGTKDLESAGLSDDALLISYAGRPSMGPERWRAALAEVVQSHDAVVVAADGPEGALALAASPDADAWLGVIVTGGTKDVDVRRAGLPFGAVGRGPTAVVTAAKRWAAGEGRGAAPERARPRGPRAEALPL
jgi:hypothetical protein